MRVHASAKTFGAPQPIRNSSQGLGTDSVANVVVTILQERSGKQSLSARLGRILLSLSQKVAGAKLDKCDSKGQPENPIGCVHPSPMGNLAPFEKIDKQDG